MKTQIQINNFQQLIEFFKRPEVTIPQIIEITNKSLIVFFTADDKTKENLIQEIEDYWETWKDTKEKPLFPDLK